MSVVIVVKVSEGLVLGADSAATVEGRIEGPQGPRTGVVKTYYNARKLLQVGDFPIGVLTYGTAFIGLRTLESLVREWEYRMHWQSQEDWAQHHRGESIGFRVETCAQELSEFLSAVYRQEYTEALPLVGVVVAGYSSQGFFPEIWGFTLPTDAPGIVHNQRPDRDGKPDFGAHWYGMTDAIVRLHFGFDDHLCGIVSEKFDLSVEAVRQALRPLEYQIPFAVMPLQDAIEYANYMLNVAVGRYRFVVGPELCGGQIEIAAITQKSFTWISRKVWSLGAKGG